MPIPDGPPRSRLAATRRSLIERLPDLEDRVRWQEFYDTYWRLIYAVSRKAGLSDAEAHDVVQETVIGVARSIGRYRRDAGSFKAWLLQLTRWRIVDQLRKRSPAAAARASSSGTATLERIADPAGAALDEVWDTEWRESLLKAALAQVKRQVSAPHFQIFDCAALKRWAPAKVAAELGVSVAQVYLVKHRIAALLKREVARLEKLP